MNVKNIEGLSKEQLKQLVNQGGKFVMFKYTVSVVVLSYRNHSDIYFIRPGEGTAKYHWGHTTLSTLMGWWGLPWGPIYTIGTLYTNLTGGVDVTLDVANQLGLTAHEGYNIPQSGGQSNTATSNGGYNIPGSNTSQNASQNQNPAQGGYNIPR